VSNLENRYEIKIRIFKALSDERRLKIVEILKSGEECACLLSEQLEIAQSSLSYHMKILCDSGLVKSRQEGKWTHYRLSKSGSETAVTLLKEMTTPNPVSLGSRCCD
jgi:ArsR family transcriptional regulator